MELMSSCMFVLNTHPRESGVSNTISSRTIVKGLVIDYNKHFKLQFGAYVPTHESHDKSTGIVCTILSLALCLIGNKKGVYFFYSLNTERTINCNNFTSLPIPYGVIYRVHKIPHNDIMVIKFTNSNEKIDGYDDNIDYVPPEKE